MCLEKKYDQYITCLIIMHALLDVLTLQSAGDREIESESELRVLIQCYFNTPRTDSVKIIYNIRMFAGAGHTRCGSGR